MGVRFAALLGALTLVLQACSSRTEVDETPDIAVQPTSGAGSQTMVSLDPAQVALGEKIFHGDAEQGTCFNCHGAKGEGNVVGPALNDNEWLNTDGSIEGIM